MSGAGKDLAEFVDEATELVESISGQLLSLDERRGEEPDPDRLNAIFRDAHTLKGLAAIYELDPIAQLAHRAEDLLDHVRLGRAPLSPEVTGALLGAVDALAAMVAAAGRGEPLDAFSSRGRELSARLERAGAGGRVAHAADPLDLLALEPQVRAVLTEYEEHRLRENVRRGSAIWWVRVEFSLDEFDRGLGELRARLKPLGEILSTLPSASTSGAERIGFSLLFGSGRAEASIKDALEGSGAALAPVRASAPPSPGAPALARATAQTVRVDIGRLDGLMSAVGELHLTRSALQRLAESAPRPLHQALLREARQLERRLADLQDGLLEARMVPVAQVFEKLSRLVRRVARDGGKEIDFAVQGEDVELDKLIVEELSDPLMHIVRNALDHGIEAPEERVRLGKPRAGRIRLRAIQQGNRAVIEIEDDGAGIDERRVREVAVARGVLGEKEAAALGPREVQALIFAPGFSTASAVSELSGRGVGLDVVKTNIARLSGVIEVQSECGKGSTFVLTLPVTLAIVRALLVSAAGRTYAVPLNAVLEIVSVEAGEVRTVEGREVVSLRDRTVPLARLARLFALPERPAQRHYVLVVGLAQQRIGIAVDALVGQQDIVTKPLGRRLEQVGGVAGAAELGSGRTVLVLDVGALMDEVLAA